MEKNSNDLSVIFAGYQNEIDELMKSNPGLASRVPYRFVFEDYSDEELLQIFLELVEHDGMKLAKNAYEVMGERIALAKTEENFGNARTIPNIYQQVKAVWLEQEREDRTIEASDIQATMPVLLHDNLNDMIGLKDVKRELNVFESRIKYIKYLLDKEGLNVSYGEIVDMFQKIYWNNGEGLINNENILFNKAFFEELSKEYNLSIFTGRLRKEAMYALKKFNADSLFFPIITTDDIPHGKGKPDPFGLNLTKEMTISDSYYYFGDTPDDILAAKAAGYTPVGVLPPQDKSEELKQTLQNAGAKFVIDSINNLKSILEQKNEAVC